MKYLEHWVYFEVEEMEWEAKTPEEMLMMEDEDGMTGQEHVWKGFGLILGKLLEQRNVGFKESEGQLKAAFATCPWLEQPLDKELDLGDKGDLEK